MSRRNMYTASRLPRWCGSGAHWLTRREDIAGGQCQPCHRTRSARHIRDSFGVPVCWACEQRSAYGTLPQGPTCTHCLREFALLDHLYQAIAKGRQPLLTHCPQGHLYSGDNLRIVIKARPRPVIYQECRVCGNTAQQRRYARRKVRVFREVLAAAQREAAHAA